MTPPRRILVVDDNADMRALCRLILEGQGYAVDEAADGDTALEMLSQDAPDLVLLDIMMPELSGWGVLTSMRENPALADVSVIILTARTDDDFRRRAQDLGLVYMTKPFYNTELANQVRHVLQGKDTWA